MRFCTRPLLIALLALVAACQGAPAPTTPEAPVDQLAPEFPDGTGQAGTPGVVSYPGPYGVGVGSTIPNFAFLGYPRASVSRVELTKMYMSDFYNPTGTELYPPGSAYGEGHVKPKALVLSRSAVWCAPCNKEAKDELPGKRLEFAPKGGEFLVALDDGPVQGTPATQANLDNWVTRYKIDYPVVLNPNASLSAIVGVDAYPGHVIVRTRDMKIVTWSSGVPDAAFWKLFDDVLAEKAVLPGD